MSRWSPLSPLAVLCECLEAGVTSRALKPETATALADPRTDLVRLAGLAGRNLVTPALAAAVFSDRALLGQLPDDFVLYLELIRSENMRRNAHLRRQLAAADGRREGVSGEPGRVRHGGGVCLRRARPVHDRENRPLDRGRLW